MKYNCTCKHAGQDALYGRQKRIWNLAPGKGGAYKSRYRCTVCGITKDIHEEKR